MLPVRPDGHKVGVKHEIGPPRFIVNAPSISGTLHFEKQFFTYPDDFEIIFVDEVGRVHTLRNIDPIDTGDAGAWEKYPGEKGFLKIQTLPRFRLRFKYKFLGLSLWETRYPSETSPSGYQFGEYEFLAWIFSYGYLFTNVWAGNYLHLIPHMDATISASQWDYVFPVRPVGKFEPKYIDKSFLPVVNLRSSYEVTVEFETLQTYDHIPLDLIARR